MGGERSPAPATASPNPPAFLGICDALSDRLALGVDRVVASDDTELAAANLGVGGGATDGNLVSLPAAITRSTQIDASLTTHLRS